MRHTLGTQPLRTTVPPVHDALARPVAMSAPVAQASTPLGEALEKTIWELHQLEKIIELGASSDDRVIEKIEDFAKTLQPLREAAEKCDDEVPVELLREVDQGKKPMGFMINQILAAGNANEVRPDFSNARDWQDYAYTRFASSPSDHTD